MKKKRKLPGKFYLAAATGILLVAAVITWNSSGEKRETEIQQQAATVLPTGSAEAATDSLKDRIGEGAGRPGGRSGWRGKTGGLGRFGAGIRPGSQP
ncbi:MAG: hypothetical protein ACLUOI_19170 [Eisenbergiella sp.]